MAKSWPQRGESLRNFRSIKVDPFLCHIANPSTKVASHVSAFTIHYERLETKPLSDFELTQSQFQADFQTFAGWQPHCPDNSECTTAAGWLQLGKTESHLISAAEERVGDSLRRKDNQSSSLLAHKLGLRQDT